MRIEETGDTLVVVDFNELEAYKIACKIEADGMKFYKKLLDKTSQENVKKALDFLFHQEQAHLKTFENALFEVEDKKETISDEKSLLSDIDYGIFQPYQSIEELENILDDSKKALKLALIIENKSIKFYQICRDRISDEEVKKEIDKIIDEEYEHKHLLEDSLNRL